MLFPNGSVRSSLLSNVRFCSDLTVCFKAFSKTLIFLSRWYCFSAHFPSRQFNT